MPLPEFAFKVGRNISRSEMSIMLLINFTFNFSFSSFHLTTLLQLKPYLVVPQLIEHIFGEVLGGAHR